MLRMANDFVSLCNRFEKKIHDLELTRMISTSNGTTNSSSSK